MLAHYKTADVTFCDILHHREEIQGKQHEILEMTFSAFTTCKVST